jgi:ketosteroid isomerase-like protein
VKLESAAGAQPRLHPLGAGIRRALVRRQPGRGFPEQQPDGTLVDRAAFLKQIAPPCAVQNLRAEDVRIRVLGDVAIIHARTTYAKPGGQAGAGRYTDVWQRRQDRWLCVSANVTRS